MKKITISDIEMAIREHEGEGFILLEDLAKVSGLSADEVWGAAEDQKDDDEGIEMTLEADGQKWVDFSVVEYLNWSEKAPLPIEQFCETAAVEYGNLFEENRDRLDD